MENEEGLEPSQFAVPLDPGWVCPYDERLLVELYRAPPGLLRTDEDRKVK
jgi:hypothetical protein